VVADNLVERLTKSKIDMVRIGNVARVLPSVLVHSLDVRVRTCDEGLIVNEMRGEIDQRLKAIQKAKSRQERRQHYSEIKALRKELVVREDKVVSSILGNARIILSTLNGSASRKLEGVVKEKGLFDTVLIDEASQALEPECWIAISKAKKVILAGDHLQLPVSFVSRCGLHIKCCLILWNN
jgi:DNA polymerase alpha-associated DNA helicase A